MTSEAARAALSQTIRRILLAHWDPLGLADTPGAADAYTHQTREVLALLSDPDITAGRVAHYLDWVERNTMHLQPREGAARAAAEKLVALPHPDADVAED
ncbi:hypothetical protein H0I76_16125 [Limibaculum sp. M0105]|uniref:Uncharacterized protein n=1 Tax=Thermohalobaculum xanthum TaxID=2753746 RepID=A0A8J7SEK8_9RHOB|nr:hypothetical protein [Thermohalobaculum xanthum]MBK0400727.1 hypothetical protein [Thermohalobaculum xanthum]